MTYDLFFRTRHADQNISVEEFADYWRDRPNGELDEDSLSDAGYYNEQSEAGFSMTYYDESQINWATGTTQEEKEEYRRFASLEMNYLKSPEQYKEIAQEVADFVKHFNLIVCDPQMDRWAVYSDFDPQKTFKVTLDMSNKLNDAIAQGRLFPLSGG